MPRFHYLLWIDIILQCVTSFAIWIFPLCEHFPDLQHHIKSKIYLPWHQTHHDVFAHHSERMSSCHQLQWIDIIFHGLFSCMKLVFPWCEHFPHPQHHIKSKINLPWHPSHYEIFSHHASKRWQDANFLHWINIIFHGVFSFALLLFPLYEHFPHPHLHITSKIYLPWHPGNQ